jgi:hypothetical protein
MDPSLDSAIVYPNQSLGFPLTGCISFHRGPIDELDDDELCEDELELELELELEEDISSLRNTAALKSVIQVVVVPDCIFQMM